jgi:hypothetical protein
MTAVKQNNDYKKGERISIEKVSINRSQIIHIKQNSTILTTKGGQNNTCYRQTDEGLVDLSASEIFTKKEHKEDSLSISEEINLLDRESQKKEVSHTINNTNNKSDNSSLGGKIIDKKDR